MGRHHWTSGTLAELVEHVMTTYHAVTLDLFDAADAELRALGAALAPTIDELHALRAEMIVHMAKEEGVLFPWLLSGRARTAAAPIRVMQIEHGDSLAQLDELRRRAAAALGTTATPRLDELERSLREHVRVEDEVLFARALTES